MEQTIALNSGEVTMEECAGTVRWGRYWKDGCVCKEGLEQLWRIRVSHGGIPMSVREEWRDVEMVDLNAKGEIIERQFPEND
jgi:hypothetical protein